MHENQCVGARRPVVEQAQIQTACSVCIPKSRHRRRPWARDGAVPGPATGRTALPAVRRLARGALPRVSRPRVGGGRRQRFAGERLGPRGGVSGPRDASAAARAAPAAIAHGARAAHYPGPEGEGAGADTVPLPAVRRGRACCGPAPCGSSRRRGCAGSHGPGCYGSRATAPRAGRGAHLGFLGGGGFALTVIIQSIFARHTGRVLRGR